MQIKYVNHFGDDLMVANVARVSFDKWKNEFDDKDAKLIEYLAKHNHKSPFFHPQLQVRVECPLFIANQLKRHQIGFAINEVSRRYVDVEPSVHVPAQFRNRPVNKKQGSDGDFSWVENADAEEIYQTSMHLSLNFYNELLRKGVAPEQARLVLPQATYTSWIWTGSMYAYFNMYNLRVSEDAQKETCDLVKQLDPIMERLYHVSWGALKKYGMKDANQ